MQIQSCYTQKWAKCIKMLDFANEIKFNNFSGALPPDPHAGERLRRPSPEPNPFSAAALRASQSSVYVPE